MNRLNWRQILIHSIAIWFFSQAFQDFSYLHDTKFLAEIIEAKQKGVEIKFLLKTKSAYEISNIFYFSGLGWIIGLLIGLITSLIIAKRRKWFWLNSILALALIFIVGRLGLSDSYFLRAIFLFPGIIMKNIHLTIIINGLILLLLGSLLFFLKKLKNIIESNKASVV